MKKTNGRIKTSGGERRAAVMSQKRIEKREKRVHRISGRTAIATLHRDRWIFACKRSGKTSK